MNTFDSDQLKAKYESFFQHFMPTGFKREKLTLDKGYVIEEMANHMNRVVQTYQHQLFSMLMKAEWIDRQMVYNDKHFPSNRARSGHLYNHAYKYFWLEYIGFSRVFLLNPWNNAIRSYAEDFFPNFNEINILDYDFPYPFKHMTIECLYLVHKMTDRLKFLREGERKGMGISEFEDYLAAWMTEEGIDGPKYHFYEGNLMNRGIRYIIRPKTLEERLAVKKL